MWIPKFLKPHAWCCFICKKFEVTKGANPPSWVMYEKHWKWDSYNFEEEGWDFGMMIICGVIDRTDVRK